MIENNVSVPLWSLFTFGKRTMLAHWGQGQGLPPPTMAAMQLSSVIPLLLKRMSSHNSAPHIAIFRCVCQAPEQRCGCVQCRHSHRCNGTWFVASLGPSGSSLVPACLHTLLLGCRQTLYPGLVSLSCAHFLQQAALGIMLA